jgi:hypothetical protein
VTEPRIARNHALFREVNERIFALSAEFGTHPAEDELGLSFVCECGNGTCAAQVMLETADYARIRANPEHYLVADGHELVDDGERVVERSPHFVVVERGAVQV